MTTKTYTFEELQTAAKPLFDKLVAETNARLNSDWFEQFYVLEKGRKYHRIVKDDRNKETGKAFEQRSCAGFIDNEGNIYKSLGWKGPAKTPRGNLFTGNLGTDGHGFIARLR